MRNLLIILFLTCCAARIVSAQDKGSINKAHALLWEISGNGLKTPAYILGTDHILGKSFIDSLGYIEPKFRACKTLVSEEIIDTSNSSKTMPMMMLKNTSLDKLFSPDEYKMINDTLDKVLHVSADQVKTVKPATLEMMIKILMEPKITNEPDSLMDTYLQDEGKKRNDHIIGLETAEFQDSLLFNTDMETQKMHLLYLMKHMNKELANARKLYSSYIQQDLQNVYDIGNDDGYNQAEHDAVLKNRNLKWMERLPAIIAANPTFIAVGVEHLAGKYGLINLLRLKGYTVTPVTK